MTERLSVAPMLDGTTRPFRYLMRGISRRTVLYTEMIVDSTLLHQQKHLYSFLRDENDWMGSGTVVQLGGFDPEDMAAAAELIHDYTGAKYSEMNINCGCPSLKVVGKCFGAKLMLDPPLVRQIAAQMIKRVGHKYPVTVKCRIGADDRDQYHHLSEFVHEVSSAGVKKFIVHARKCHLSGLSTKQNRSVPPLQYDVVHRLAAEYPELEIILNGGLQSLDEVDLHLGLPTNDIVDNASKAFQPPVQGCMIGRAVYTNPFLLANADTRYFDAPCDLRLSRGELLDRYYDFCDVIVQEVDSLGGESQLSGGESQLDGYDNRPEFGSKDGSRCHTTCVDGSDGSIDNNNIKFGKVVDAVKNVFHGCPGAGKYRQRLKEIYSAASRSRRSSSSSSSFVGDNLGALDPSLIIQQAVEETIRPQDLDVIPGD